MVACKSHIKHDKVERLDGHVHRDGIFYLAISTTNVRIIIEEQKGIMLLEITPIGENNIVYPTENKELYEELNKRIFGIIFY